MALQAGSTASVLGHIVLGHIVLSCLTLEMSTLGENKEHSLGPLPISWADPVPSLPPHGTRHCFPASREGLMNSISS